MDMTPPVLERFFALRRRASARRLSRATRLFTATVVLVKTLLRFCEKPPFLCFAWLLSHTRLDLIESTVLCIFAGMESRASRVGLALKLTTPCDTTWCLLAPGSVRSAVSAGLYQRSGHFFRFDKVLLFLKWVCVSWV